jgi:GTP-binding protein YchF
MKLGIVGLTGAGKSTVFEALTRNIQDVAYKKDGRIGTVRVPDSRVDILSGIYKPKKTVYAQVEYFLPGMQEREKQSGKEQDQWAKVRDCDALIHVVKNYDNFGSDKSDPYKDILALDQELIIADLMVVEKRLERLRIDKKRGRNIDQEELTLLEECLAILENETPIRRKTGLAAARPLRGYAFLSAKPVLILFNNDDEDDSLPETDGNEINDSLMVIRGKLEQELVQMSEEDAAEFLSEFNISVSAMNRVIEESYRLLGLISFFTVGEDEVRAWTIKHGTAAVDAAEVIHSDIKKGFIRAEVLAYDDLMDAATYQEARKKGSVRLEGKTYQVKDGDIINFRFNV